MQVQKIHGNCSMISVSDNPSKDITKFGFLMRLNNAIDVNNREKNCNYIVKKDVKCVMLTTNAGWYLWPFLTRGFSYKGNYRYSRARVKFMRFPNGLLNKLTKEGII